MAASLAIVQPELRPRGRASSARVELTQCLEVYDKMSKKVASSRSRYRLPYQAIIAVVLLMAIIRSLPSYQGSWKQLTLLGSVFAKSQTMVGKGITFVEVPSERSDVKRYAAVQKKKNSSEEPVSIRSWMTAVASSSPTGIQAASGLSDIISSSSYEAVLFETKGSSWQSSSEDQFEFALVDDVHFVLTESNPDKDAFAEHFSACKSMEREDTVCSFANLGGDAHLVAPLPQTNVNDSSYSHLAAFVRNAPKSQVAEFWRVSASEYLAELERNQKVNPNAKTWFSTNGMGVAWLHLRLDSRPKYYSYGPFRR